MRTIVVGECTADHIFKALDPTAPTEAEFELVVARALTCVYADYHCIMFGGTFVLDGRGSRPDLALVSRDYSHWFVIEVELVSHSLDGHVLPQVRAFRYGEPQPDCVAILARELALDPARATTLLRYVPRCVGVVANRREPQWEAALRGLDTQLLSVTAFGSPSGVVAYDVDGTLQATEECLGFGKYSAMDRALCFPTTIRIEDGTVAVDEPRGATAAWIVERTRGAAWMTKKIGVPDIPHAAYVLLARTYAGRLVLRVP